MPIPIDAPAVLVQDFLILRAKLLEVAAGFDRLDRARGDVTADPRYQNMQRAVKALLNPKSDRAEQLQLIFSLPYDKEWKAKFEMK